MRQFLKSVAVVALLLSVTVQAAKISQYPHTNALGNGDYFITERADGLTNNSITWSNLLVLINAQLPPGGDTIWTNDAGSIELIGNPGSLSIDAAFGNVSFAGSLTLSTNLVVLDPLAPDGTTPHTLGSSIAHTSDTLVIIDNSTNAVASIGFSGGYYVGPQTLPWWGGASKGDALIAYNDEFTSGDSHDRNITLEQDNTDPDLNTFASLSLAVNSGSTKVTFQGQDDSGVNGNMTLQVVNGLPELRMNDGSIGILVRIAPSIADGTVPFSYDTRVAHTGLLFTLSNFATNQFAVAASTGWTGTGTNYFGDDGAFHALPAGGGGDTIWTNSAGTVQLISAASLFIDNQSGGTSQILFDNGNTTLFQEGFLGVQKANIAGANPSGVNGLFVSNPYISSSMTQQNSPAVSWGGTGWETDDGASHPFNFGSYIVMASGTAEPHGALTFRWSVNNGSYNDALALDDDATANDTRLLVYDVSAGSLVRVSRGATDSGGTGKRALVIPN